MKLLKLKDIVTFPLHGVLTPPVDTVPFKHSPLSLFFHPFILHAEGLLTGPVFAGNHLLLAFSKGQSSQRVRKQGKVTGFPAAKKPSSLYQLLTSSPPHLSRLAPRRESARFSSPGDIKRVIKSPVWGNHDWLTEENSRWTSGRAPDGFWIRGSAAT